MARFSISLIQKMDRDMRAIESAMEAESLDELGSVINESVHALLLDLLADNELEAFLREKGWTANNIPVGIPTNDINFEIPWQLVADFSRGSERYAS